MSYIQEALEVRDKPRERQKALKRLLDELRPELVKITSADIVLSISRKELVEQVSFILSEILRKYAFKLTSVEIRDMALTLSNDLIATFQKQVGFRTIN